MIIQNAQQMADHVRALARAFDVALLEQGSMPPERAIASQLILPGVSPLKAVIVAPVIDETTYAVALHELGHCLAPLGSLPFEKQRLQSDSVEFFNVVLLEEEAAWDWARHYALEWTPLMQTIQDFSCRTYTEGKKRAAAERQVQEAWTRRHRVESVGSFLGKIGRNIRLE